MKSIDWSYIITGAFTAILGPVIGPFAMLLFAAIIGSLLPLSKEGDMTPWQGTVYIGVCCGIALILSGFCVWMVERYTNVPGHIALMPAAFALSAGRPFILGFVGRLYDGVANAFDAVLTRGPKP